MKARSCSVESVPVGESLIEIREFTAPRTFPPFAVGVHFLRHFSAPGFLDKWAA